MIKMIFPVRKKTREKSSLNALRIILILQAKELLMTGQDFLTPEKYLTKSKGYFANNMSAIHQYFMIDPGDITYESQTTLWITLNKSLNYYIYLMDPKLHITSVSPDIVPRILLTLNKNTQLFFHYKVTSKT